MGIALDEPEPGDAWRELFASVALPTSIGPVITRAGRAERGADEGIEISAEAYPRIDTKTYVWLQAADLRRFGRLSRLAPRRGGLSHVRTASGKDRSAIADSSSTIPPICSPASLGRYTGSWLLFSRVFVAGGDSSVQLGARRYSGDGREFIGVRVARGSAREQIRTDIDLAAFDTTEVALESRFVFGSRWLGDMNLGYGSGEDGAPDRFFATAALGVRF